jgi:hypothetical protein
VARPCSWLASAVQVELDDSDPPTVVPMPARRARCPDSRGACEQVYGTAPNMPAADGSCIWNRTARGRASIAHWQVQKFTGDTEFRPAGVLLLSSRSQGPGATEEPGSGFGPARSQLLSGPRRTTLGAQ